ncbi:MetQ/NlpA family lipoprotein, partial [Escherichia coli]|nr:MetQ/NlpA family lipoprotein [Escherichia coli]
GGTADRNRSHWSTSKTPSYTKSVSWQHHHQAHGYKLVAVGNTFVFPMAGYSKKIKTVAQIKEGATVAIPNDPTNLGRALLLLQKEKLITLKEGKGLLPTALDITDNPRHLQIMELEGAQLPRVLDEPKVDVAIISTTYIQQTGLSPVHDSVFIEDKNSPYVNILVAREDNKNAENVKEFLQSYQSSEVAKAAETIFNGGAVPGW